MAYNKFSFEPEAGFLDSGFYDDTPENSREILQRQHNQTRDYINSLIETLNSDKEGLSGSESIMSPKIEGVNGTNVFDQIKDIKRQINDAADMAVPDSSITTEKLAASSVTEEKIKDKSITSEKFSEDAVAPFSYDALNLNDISSKMYAPLCQTGFSGGFKERVSDVSFSSVYGKNYMDKRYMLKDKNLYTLNLLSGEFEKVSEKEVTGSKLAVLDENTIFITSISKKSDDYIYLKVSKYNKEYDEVTESKEIKLFDASYGSYKFIDMDVSESYLFLGFQRYKSSTYYNYIYKLSLDTLFEITESEIYYSVTSSNFDKSFFISEGDLYFGKNIYKDCKSEEILNISFSVRDADLFGNLLSYSSSLPIYDKETLLPKFADLNSGDYNGFLFNNYYYVLVGGYLFKARIS